LLCVSKNKTLLIMKHIRKFNEDKEYDEIFYIVKSHCISDDDDLIKDAMEEAYSFGGFDNNNSELIAFVNGYIIGLERN
jgi:uncharacterized protein with von Willebrand factor type A (vWA) domain